ACRLVVLVVGEEPCADPVPLEQAAGVARVLREHELGLAQLRENPQRDVFEIPDRRRADRERHYRSASNARSPAPISPAPAPSSAGSISTSWPGGASASVRTAGARAGERSPDAPRANPAPDPAPLGAEDVHERADRDAEVMADLLEHRM